MNADRIALYMHALQTHFAKTKGVHHVLFRHDASCPCEPGHLPLDHCTCDPVVEIGGKKHKLVVTAQFVSATT